MDSWHVRSQALHRGNAARLHFVRVCGVALVCLCLWIALPAGSRADAISAVAPPLPTPPAASSPYRLPWPGGVSVTCVQGNHGSFSHTGAQAYAWDFAMPTGSVIEAARAGVVRYVGLDSNVGGVNWKEDVSQANYIVIDQGDGTSGAYLHLMFHGALVKVGDNVRQGQPIAYSGATGFASGPHLHFQVEKTDSESWFSQSLPVRFADVASNNGVPVQGSDYVSGNAPTSISSAPVVVNITNAPAAPKGASGGATASALDATFVSDVNYPDGSTVHGGQTFTKAWTLRNSGALSWPGGSHLSLQGNSAFQVLSTATVDAVPPGASANVSVTLRVPTDLGGTSEQQQWRLAGSDGNAFGPTFWLRLTVGDNLPTLAVPSAAASGKQYFSQTGHNVGWPFLQFYRTHGGLDSFGYPRTEALQENGLNVQYFQRARFEYHPELVPGQQVQITLLGDTLTKDQQPFSKSASFTSSAQHAYFPQTGHSVNFGFLQYFNARGGITVFGYPISEELQVGSTHGPTTIQYFQRARFEYHPEFAGTPYAVELGLLGDQDLTAIGWLPVPTPTTPPATKAAPAPASAGQSTQSPVVADTTPTPTAPAPAPGPSVSSMTGSAATVSASGLRIHSAPGASANVTGYLAS
ncbi:MAG TPA: NBR1-Ig-like domain-containing protein, partial [Chloroflexota bacterium]|nr:NBR1-Ig-like domain-containing protein [Chloroflexota bacterium]